MLQSMRRLPCEFPGCDRNAALPSEADRPHGTDLALCVDHGQLLSRDADGFYVHGGRSDDMIKAGGMWVSPVEVEGGASHRGSGRC